MNMTTKEVTAPRRESSGFMVAALSCHSLAIAVSSGIDGILANVPDGEVKVKASNLLRDAIGQVLAAGYELNSAARARMFACMKVEDKEWPVPLGEPAVKERAAAWAEAFGKQGNGSIPVRYRVGEKVEFRHAGPVDSPNANPNAWRDGTFSGYSAYGTGRFLVRADGADYACVAEDVRLPAVSQPVPHTATLDRV